MKAFSTSEKLSLQLSLPNLTDFNTHVIPILTLFGDGSSKGCTDEGKQGKSKPW